MTRSPGPTGAARRAVAALLCAAGAATGLGACSREPPPADFATPAARPSERLDLTGRDDLVDRHPNGSVLQVRAVEVRARSVEVEVSVINGFPERIDLVTEGLFRDRWLWLVDDRGNSYRFDGRASLTVGPGEELVGALVFLGPLPDDVEQVALKANVADPVEPVDARERDLGDSRPVFYVQGIPVP
ncbi:MAG: hypothetical protein ACFCVG_07320 [Kineosporiaceae bacterium]